MSLHDLQHLVPGMKNSKNVILPREQSPASQAHWVLSPSFHSLKFTGQSQRCRLAEQMRHRRRQSDPSDPDILFTEFMEYRLRLCPVQVRLSNKLKGDKGLRTPGQLDNCEPDLSRYTKRCQVSKVTIST